MKRIVFLFAAAAMCARLPGVYAQDLSEPDEQSVLQKARDKYGQGSAPSETTEAPESPDEAASDRPYSPFVLSFVPGTQFPPFGLYDTSLAFGLIGSSVGSLDGFQGSGVFNIARDVEGFQGAGVFNIARDVEGFQGAGVFNIARNVEGFQMSGTFNIADTVDGGMAAGVFNAADRVSGTMIGLVNVADHLDGVAVGLINIIGNGVNEIGIQYIPAEDMTYASYRTGTRSLYSVYYAGLGNEDWFMDGDTLIVGFGFGSRVESQGAGLDFEIGIEQELYPDRLAALEAASRAGDEEAFCDLLRPYPAARIVLFAPVLGFKAFIGLETDFDVPAWGSYVPDRVRVSSFDSQGWRGDLFGLGFTAWPKLFLGLSF